MIFGFQPEIILLFILLRLSQRKRGFIICSRRNCFLHGVFISVWTFPKYKESLETCTSLLLFAENAIAGVPCGIMDQLACYHGKLKHLIPFTCSLPPLVGKQLEFSKKYLKLWGIDSTVRHFNGNSSYGESEQLHLWDVILLLKNHFYSELSKPFAL